VVISRLDYHTIVSHLSLLLFLAVPHLSRALKNAGLARKFDKILTRSFLFSAKSISWHFDKKNTKKDISQVALTDFGLDNLLFEGNILDARRIFVCR
jgi:hypothetical protein